MYSVATERSTLLGHDASSPRKNTLWGDGGCCDRQLATRLFVQEPPFQRVYMFLFFLGCFFEDWISCVGVLPLGLSLQAVVWPFTVAGVCVVGWVSSVSARVRYIPFILMTKSGMKPQRSPWEMYPSLLLTTLVFPTIWFEDRCYIVYVMVSCVLKERSYWAQYRMAKAP